MWGRKWSLINSEEFPCGWSFIRGGVWTLKGMADTKEWPPHYNFLSCFPEENRVEGRGTGAVSDLQVTMARKDNLISDLLN